MSAELDTSKQPQSVLGGMVVIAGYNGINCSCDDGVKKPKSIFGQWLPIVRWRYHDLFYNCRGAVVCTLQNSIYVGVITGIRQIEIGRRFSGQLL